MVKKSKGPLRKSRHKLRGWRRIPRPTVARMLQIFNVGDRVVIRVHPSVQRGRPRLRFVGRVGEIVGKQGSAYIVRIRDGKSYKDVLALPIHLKKVVA